MRIPNLLDYSVFLECALIVFTPRLKRCHDVKSKEFFSVSVAFKGAGSKPPPSYEYSNHDHPLKLVSLVRLAVSSWLA